MPHRRRDYDNFLGLEEHEEEEALHEEEALNNDDDDGGCGAGRKRRRFIDEDDDEEEDFNGGCRAKRRPGSEFFDLEAAVDSDEEEEEGEEGEDDFIVDGGADILDEDGARRMHPLPLLPREDDQEDVEALERSIQARYSRSSHIEYDEETIDVKQQALLPSVRDPKLWMVRCAIGHEREAAVSLMQKYIDKGSELKIRSAIALDHLKNYIYIEADKEAHVREACKGMRNIFSNKVMMVPIKEMTDVLSVESKAIDLSRDTWVRMKIGTYKGDLAKVVDVDNVRQRVTVKLIPRIDLQALANKLEGREVPKKAAFVPPPRFMSVDEARKMHIRVERKRDSLTGEYFEYINGMRFKEGFLYKTVSVKSISTQHTEPSFDELVKFRQDIAGSSTLFANKKKGHFMMGDQVIVVKGDLKNLKGQIEKVDEDTIHIRPKAVGLARTLALNERQLCKYFEPGSHLKVVSGAAEGTTGMVITVEGHRVIILSDTTKEHVHVFADSVVEVTTGVCEGESLASRFANRVPQYPRRFPRGGPPIDSGGRSRGHDSLVGTSIKVCQGPFKGCRGRVVDVKSPSVRVELESQMKVVTVHRNHISEYEAPAWGGNYIEALTPMRSSPVYVQMLQALTCQ